MANYDHELVKILADSRIYERLLKENNSYEGMGRLYDLCSDIDNLPKNLNVLYENNTTGNSLVSIKSKSYGEKYALLKINKFTKKISVLEKILEVPEGFLLT